MTKKILAVLLALAMTMSLFSFNVFAAGSDFNAKVYLYISDISSVDNAEVTSYNQEYTVTYEGDARNIAEGSNDRYISLKSSAASIWESTASSIPEGTIVKITKLVTTDANGNEKAHTFDGGKATYSEPVKAEGKLEVDIYNTYGGASIKHGDELPESATKVSVTFVLVDPNAKEDPEPDTGKHPEGEKVVEITDTTVSKLGENVVDIADGAVTSSAEQFAIKIPEIANLNDKITVHIKGTTSGDFRMWAGHDDGAITMSPEPLWKASEKGVEFPTPDGEEFDVTYTLVVADKDGRGCKEADCVIFKGASYGVNLDNLKITHFGYTIEKFVPEVPEPKGYVSDAALNVEPVADDDANALVVTPSEEVKTEGVLVAFADGAPDDGNIVVNYVDDTPPKSPCGPNDIEVFFEPEGKSFPDCTASWDFVGCGGLWDKTYASNAFNITIEKLKEVFGKEGATFTYAFTGTPGWSNGGVPSAVLNGKFDADSLPIETETKGNLTIGTFTLADLVKKSGVAVDAIENFVIQTSTDNFKLVYAYFTVPNEVVNPNAGDDTPPKSPCGPNDIEVFFEPEGKSFPDCTASWDFVGCGGLWDKTYASNAFNITIEKLKEVFGKEGATFTYAFTGTPGWSNGGVPSAVLNGKFDADSLPIETETKGNLTIGTFTLADLVKKSGVAVDAIENFVIQTSTDNFKLVYAYFTVPNEIVNPNAGKDAPAASTEPVEFKTGDKYVEISTDAKKVIDSIVITYNGKTVALDPSAIDYIKIKSEDSNRFTGVDGYAIQLGPDYHGFFFMGRLITMPHTFDENNICTACDFVKPASEGDETVVDVPA